VRRVGATRAIQLALYAKLKAKFLKEMTVCHCCGRSVHPQERDLHHFYGRTGRLLTWEPGFRMVHRHCHQVIHDNPRWAAAIGLLSPPALWNNYRAASATLATVQ